MSHRSSHNGLFAKENALRLPEIKGESKNALNPYQMFQREGESPHPQESSINQKSFLSLVGESAMPNVGE